MRARFRMAHVADALKKSAGIISGAAQILDCAPKTVRDYIARYPKLKEVLAETVEFNLDLCETKLLAAVSKEADWAVKFYLETKGKHRGYTRRQEITGADGKPLEATDARDRFIAQLAEIGERLVGHLTAGGPGAAGEARPNGADPAPAPAEQ